MTDHDNIYVVCEHRADTNTHLRRAFSNSDAANDYINDPENRGPFSIEELSLLDEWDQP